IINLGNGEGYSVLEIIKAAEEVTQQSIQTKLCERRAGDPAKLVACNTKAQEILGWKPKYTNIKEIINTAWIFYTNQK
ncbi:MAG: UDP-glucose 4-epimerase GalE, partial [Erysipelotrichaceae bacterium]|nr:UDP-glucose 4-epimerase GalE [Erysipelotrichaceae bacterium]